MENQNPTSALWRRNGDRLFIKDTDDYLLIVESDGFYPEMITCADTEGVKLQFRQVAPNLYVFEKEAS